MGQTERGEKLENRSERVRREFFLGLDTVTLARKLIGMLFVHEYCHQTLAGIISETEAYTQEDRASHSFNGPTNRNQAMFGRPGTLYVYLIYGVHYCANVVAEEQGRGCAVLLRTLLPFKGLHHMAQNRQKSPTHPTLTCGPANLTKALGITLKHNKTDLCLEQTPLFLTPSTPPLSITATPRIGISKNQQKLWRFIGQF